MYEGQPGIECTAKAPESLLSGMNRFLKHLSITFRRDPNNYRPRINKKDSQKDKEQKGSGNYFFMEDWCVCYKVYYVFHLKMNPSPIEGSSECFKKDI